MAVGWLVGAGTHLPTQPKGQNRHVTMILKPVTIKIAYSRLASAPRRCRPSSSMTGRRAMKTIPRIVTGTPTMVKAVWRYAIKLGWSPIRHQPHSMTRQKFKNSKATNVQVRRGIGGGASFGGGSAGVDGGVGESVAGDGTGSVSCDTM